jgi:hypothetical protein
MADMRAAHGLRKIVAWGLPAVARQWRKIVARLGSILGLIAPGWHGLDLGANWRLGSILGLIGRPHAHDILLRARLLRVSV